MTIGSTPPHGTAPCVCRPRDGDGELVGARHERTRPVDDVRRPETETRAGRTRRPPPGSSARRPSPSARRRPGPSSAGWKMNFTVPGSCVLHAGQHRRPRPSGSPCGCRGRRRASRRSPAPFHCAFAVDLNGRSTCSVTGRPSMSARSATTGPGLPPLSTPTTPWPRRARPPAPPCPATADGRRRSSTCASPACRARGARGSRAATSRPGAGRLRSGVRRRRRRPRASARMRLRGRRNRRARPRGGGAESCPRV